MYTRVDILKAQNNRATTFDRRGIHRLKNALIIVFVCCLFVCARAYVKKERGGGRGIARKKKGSKRKGRQT